MTCKHCGSKGLPEEFSGMETSGNPAGSTVTVAQDQVYDLRPATDSNMPEPILIVSAGHTYRDLQHDLGDFADWIEQGLGVPESVARIDARTGLELPALNSLAGIVVTGSHAMVTDRLDWSERLAAWLRDAVAGEVPVLGICYGHQLLAYACGGVVGDRPQGRELGTVSIELTAEGRDDPLFDGMPPNFPGNMAHQQSVLTLPLDAVRLASSAAEANQAFRLGSCAWGVQFHPEFSGEVMRHYVVRSNVPDADQSARDTPIAAKVLVNFRAACGA